MSEAAETINSSQSPRWNQFTIRRLLLAMLWAALGLGLFGAINYAPLDASRTLDITPQLVLPCFAIVYLTPFLAVGALFGRTLKGLMTGIIVEFLFVIALFAAISNGWVRFP